MSGTPNQPAVILGLAAAGLAPLRVLGVMGVPCLGIWRDPRLEFGRHSKHLLRSIQVPAAPSHGQLVAALDELTAPWRDAKPVLIPSSDLYAAFVDEMQDELRGRYTLRCSKRRLHAAFADKAATIDLCTEADVPIPRSRAVATSEDVQSVGRDFRFPVIVKPRQTHGIGFPGKNFVADSSREFAGFFEQHPRLVGQCVAQEVVPSGDGRILGSISYSGRDGTVLAQATFRKRRQWPPDYGVSCLGRSEWIPEIASLTERLLNGVGYQGFAAAEFAEHAETGRYYVLEVNPRLSLPIQLALDAGVDLIGIGWREMTGSGSGDAVPPGPSAQIDGVDWIDLRRDLLSVIHKYRRDRIGLAEWARSLAPVTSHASLDWRDPKPWLASTAVLVRDLAGLLGRYLEARVRGGRR
jgi:predicted ATP-grasp superfamily ATP-dependent carboligase